MHGGIQRLPKVIGAIAASVMFGLGAGAGRIPAFADMAGGGISGGFFSASALPGNTLPGSALPASALPGSFFGSSFGGGVGAPFVGSAPLGSTGVPSGAPLPDFCGPAIAQASAGRQLPPGLLNAMARVESGRPDARSGRLTPWPWTIDANGAGYIYPTEQAAERAAAAFEAAGITSLDIGCLQVNLAQHPDAFASLAQAFDPAANANYAADFLLGLERKFGNWPQAVAAYHSQTPALGEPYVARVFAQWQGHAPAMALADATSAPAPGMTPGPGISPGLGLGMSPLVPPARIMLQPGTRLTGRSLASYRAAPVPIASALPPPG